MKFKFTNAERAQLRIALEAIGEKLDHIHEETNTADTYEIIINGRGVINVFEHDHFDPGGNVHTCTMIGIGWYRVSFDRDIGEDAEIIWDEGVCLSNFVQAAKAIAIKFADVRIEQALIADAVKRNPELVNFI